MKLTEMKLTEKSLACLEWLPPLIAVPLFVAGTLIFFLLAILLLPMKFWDMSELP